MVILLKQHSEWVHSVGLNVACYLLERIISICLCRAYYCGLLNGYWKPLISACFIWGNYSICSSSRKIVFPELHCSNHVWCPAHVKRSRLKYATFISKYCPTLCLLTSPSLASPFIMPLFSLLYSIATRYIQKWRPYPRRPRSLHFTIQYALLTHVKIFS